MPDDGELDGGDRGSWQHGCFGGLHQAGMTRGALDEVADGAVADTPGPMTLMRDGRR